MRSRASSKHSRSMEVERPKLKEEPHLSGAYIRSLVKQLSSSRPRELMIPKSQDVAVGDGSPRNLAKFSPSFSESQQQPPQPQPPQQPKKQIRRRLHTSRPYQERVLNMAEARREIVTALKFHRAAMKQASEQQQKQLSPPPPPPPPPPQVEEPHKEKATRKNPRTYRSTGTTSLFTHFNNPTFPSISYPPFLWPYTSISPLPIPESLNLTLPSRPLGLNLNFHRFTNIENTSFCNNNCNPSVPSSASSSSSSSCSYSSSSLPTMTTMSGPDTRSASNGPSRASETTSEAAIANGVLHRAMDEEEMAEIRSIGEQHEMEWNDRLNLVTSAWWCNLLRTMEMENSDDGEAGIGGGGEGDDGLHLFEEMMDAPSWLSDQQHFCDYYLEDYLQDAALPCLDIGEIEGKDWEWLS